MWKQETKALSRYHFDSVEGQRHLVKQSSSNQSDQRPHAYEAEGLTNTLLHLVE
jgi:hypothetical protein